MMAFLRRALGAEIAPVTHLDVAPAAGIPEKERELKEAKNKLAHALVDFERHSWEIRQDLAGKTLRIVAGD
jgi:hypothetical protein